MATTYEITPAKVISDINDGEYTVLSYEKKKSKFGNSYILTLDNKDRIWANGYISNYIYDESPTKKFLIIIKDGRVTIPGYSRIVVLK